MNRTDRLPRAGNSGFTLIEVLLVVVIIGILLGIAIPKLTGHTQRAEITAARANLRTISMKVQEFELNYHRLPRTLDEIQSPPADVQDWRGPAFETGLPQDPWKHDFTYACPGTHNPYSFDLSSLGPDGVPSADDITNWAESGGTR